MTNSLLGTRVVSVVRRQQAQNILTVATLQLGAQTHLRADELLFQRHVMKHNLKENTVTKNLNHTVQILDCRIHLPQSKTRIQLRRRAPRRHNETTVVLLQNVHVKTRMLRHTMLFTRPPLAQLVQVAHALIVVSPHSQMRVRATRRYVSLTAASIEHALLHARTQRVIGSHIQFTAGNRRNTSLVCGGNQAIQAVHAAVVSQPNRTVPQPSCRSNIFLNGRKPVKLATVLGMVV